MTTLPIALRNMSIIAFVIWCIAFITTFLGVIKGGEKSKENFPKVLLSLCIPVISYIISYL